MLTISINPNDLTRRIIAACMMLTMASLRAEPIIDLPDGNRIEIVKISHGTSHNVDTRTLADKAYLNLPESFQKMYLRITEGGEMSITGPDSVALGFVFRKQIPGNPALADYHYILSDSSGWYQSGELKGMFGETRESFVFGVHMAPRASQTLKLSVFSPKVSKKGPAAPLASLTFDNPQYDSTLVSASPDLYSWQTTASAHYTPIRYLTGILLEDITNRTSAYSRASTAIPESISRLWNHGRSVRAEMPRVPSTILWFQDASTSASTDQLVIRNVSLEDSHGQVYPVPNLLYQQGKNYALVVYKYIPTTDGKTKIRFTVVENPPADSPLWQFLPVNPDGIESSVTFTSGSKLIKLKPTANAHKFHMEMSPVKWGEDFGNYAVEVIGQDRQPLPFIYEDQETDGKTHSVTISLNESNTTAPYHVRLAPPILNDVTLTAVPDRP